jgi:hypothetical protein
MWSCTAMANGRAASTIACVIWMSACDGTHCQGYEEHELRNGSLSLEWQSAKADVRRRDRRRFSH